MLERCALKKARTVLRGLRISNDPWLPDNSTFQLVGRDKQINSLWLTWLIQTARRRTDFVLEYYLFLPLQFVPS